MISDCFIFRRIKILNVSSSSFFYRHFPNGDDTHRIVVGREQDKKLRAMTEMLVIMREIDRQQWR